MMNNDLTADKKRRIIESGVVFTLLFFSNDTILFGTNANGSFFWIQFIALILLLFFLLIKNKTVTLRNLVVFFVFSILILVTLAFNSDFSIKYPYEIMMILISIMVVQFLPFETFKKMFCFWIEAFCLVAVFLFFIASFVSSLIGLLPIVVNETGINYHFAILGIIEELGYSSLPRVYGIFREPGVFMVFIIIALLLETVLSDCFSIRRVLLYVIGLLLSFSTAGYILLAVVFSLLIMKTIHHKKSKKQNKRFFFFLILAILAAIILVCMLGYDAINALVFNKLRVSNQSFDSRLGSIFGNINMFREKPLFGHGFSYFEDNFTYYASMSGYYEAHNTNTLFKILSVHGFFYFFFVLSGLFLLIKKNCKRLVIVLIAFMCFILALSNEDLMVNTIIYVFVLYGFQPSKAIWYENNQLF